MVAAVTMVQHLLVVVALVAVVLEAVAAVLSLCYQISFTLVAMRL